MDFVEKRSSYLEKASHSIEKKRFVVQNGGGQPLLWNFKGDDLLYLEWVASMSMHFWVCQKCICSFMFVLWFTMWLLPRPPWNASAAQVKQGVFLRNKRNAPATSCVVGVGKNMSKHFGLAKNASASSTTDNLAFAKVALNCERSSSLAECFFSSEKKGHLPLRLWGQRSL